jgi:hypothetical protein
VTGRTCSPPIDDTARRTPPQVRAGVLRAGVLPVPVDIEAPTGTGVGSYAARRG